MNITELTNELKSIEERERELSEKVVQLENERREKEQNQLSLVGQEKKRVPKSDEQLQLEAERSNLIVAKNRIHSTIANYNQMKVFAEQSDYNGMTIDDFKKMLEDYDEQRKEYASKIDSLEKERKEKEKNQLVLVGKEPKPVPKSEEQIQLESKKLETEIKFQRTANTISLYNRIMKELDGLKSETDFNKYISEYNTLLYKAKRSGLPDQLILNIMDHSNIVKSEENNSIDEEQPQVEETPVTKPQNVAPDIIYATKQETREEELERLLRESSKRYREALELNDENAIATERGYRQWILEELAKLRNQQISYIKKTPAGGTEANPTPDTNTDEISEEAKKEPVEEKPEKEIEESSKPEIEVEKEEEEETELLNDEQIKEKISELEAKRKEIASKIEMINLSKELDEDELNLMDEFVAYGRESNKLRSLLPEKIERKEAEPVEKEETKAQEVEENIKPIEEVKETKEEKTEIEEKKTGRLLKFKHFVTKTIPSWVIRLGFALKRAIDKGINISQDIEIPSYVSEDTNVVSKESNEEIRDISDEAEILEDENTMDFSREKFDLEKDGAENMQSQFENPEEQQNSFRRAM